MLIMLPPWQAPAVAAPTGGTNNTLWLKADAIAGLSNDDAVQTWNDSSGKGYNVTEATLANRPIFKNTGAFPYVRGNGTSQKLSSSVAMSSIVTNSAYTSMTVLRVADVSSNVANSWENDAVWIDSTNYLGLTLKRSGSPGSYTYTAGAYNYDGTDDFPNLSFSLNTWMILTTWHSAGTMYIQKNNETPVSIASGNTQQLTGVLRLFGGSSTNKFLNGDIAETLFYNRVLTSGEFNNDLAYLNGKFSIY